MYNIYCLYVYIYILYYTVVRGNRPFGGDYINDIYYMYIYYILYIIYYIYYISHGCQHLDVNIYYKYYPYV